MIPWECKQSIARAISKAKPTASLKSKHLGLILNRYFRNVPPERSSVTITIIGSLQAPINWDKSTPQSHKLVCNSIYYQKREKNEDPRRLHKGICQGDNHITSELYVIN